MTLSRRQALLTLGAIAAAPHSAFARTHREITWDDLIPKGVPYSEIIGEGFLDEQNDVWRPIFDQNATKLNTDLDGASIKMPGFVLPLDVTRKGVKDFLLVPYVGACIHTPPPPPNQLVLVHSADPWPDDDLWAAVWVLGTMQAKISDTDIAQTGYHLTAESMEYYEW